MSLKSVDLQTAIPKSTEIAKVKQVEDRDASNRQQQFATQFQQRVERQQRQVTSSPQTRNPKVDPDSRGNQQGGAGEEGKERREPGRSPGDPTEAAKARPEPGPGRGKKLDIVI